LLGVDRSDSASAEDVDREEPAANSTEDPSDAVFSSPLGRNTLLRLLALMDLVEVDSKWRECAQVLQTWLPEAHGSAVLFCDFVYTAQYVAGLISEEGIPVELVTAATPAEVKVQSLESFRSNLGVLVLTSGAAEGVGLSFVKLCLHYDLPWSPTALARRLGRIHRVGATPGPVRHVLFTDDVLLPEPLARRLFSLGVDFGDMTRVDALPEILGLRGG
jgi:superfamily II DNA/RNA helicase